MIVINNYQWDVIKTMKELDGWTMIKQNLSYRQLRLIARAVVSEDKLNPDHRYSKRAIYNKKSLYNKIYKYADKYI